MKRLYGAVALLAGIAVTVVYVGREQLPQVAQFNESPALRAQARPEAGQMVTTPAQRDTRDAPTRRRQDMPL